jgi:hypothetical protein
MFALKTEGLKTEEGAGKREIGKLWAGREAICYTLFELRRSWHFRLRRATTRRRRRVAEEDNDKNILSTGGWDGALRRHRGRNFGLGFGFAAHRKMDTQRMLEKLRKRRRTWHIALTVLFRWRIGGSL